MAKFVIGIDYGTLSARAVLADQAGNVVSQAEYVYPHAVMGSDAFPGEEILKTDAFQHPQDYLDALSSVIGDVLRAGNVDAAEVAGLGIDFTSCTPLPVLEDGTALCCIPAYEGNPQAYPKLWKHNSAQKEADAITKLARETGAPHLEYYGKISAEWFFPKLWETYRKAPQVLADCHRYMEAGDWLTYLLTGREVKSACFAGYKAQWNKKDGFPSKEFWKKLDPGFADVVEAKVGKSVQPTGSLAGYLNEKGSLLTGLPQGVSVAVPIIDAHASLPAAGITDAGEMVLITGTSSCQLTLSTGDTPVAGISGSVKNGVLPGFMAMEAGQAAVGDTFRWFVDQCMPEDYAREARDRNMSPFALLTEKAEKLRPGQSGLLAIDWFNGNRVPYADADLTGVILGLTLHTKPEEIFRALIEATAFGTKAVVDTFEQNGVRVQRVYAAGGISHKNPFMMQLYADVLGKEIRIVPTAQATAKGSCMLAAAAAGLYPDVISAVQAMADPWEISYAPNMEHHEKYLRIYEQYKRMSAFFAEDPVLKELK